MNVGQALYLLSYISSLPLTLGVLEITSLYYHASLKSFEEDKDPIGTEDRSVKHRLCGPGGRKQHLKHPGKGAVSGQGQAPPAKPTSYFTAAL